MSFCLSRHLHGVEGAAVSLRPTFPYELEARVLYQVAHVAGGLG